MMRCCLCGNHIPWPAYLESGRIHVHCQACVRGADEVQRELRTIEELALEFKAPYHGMADASKRGAPTN